MSTLSERLSVLGWTKLDPRSGYDRAVFLLLEELVREVESLRAENSALREDVASALVSGGTLG